MHVHGGDITVDVTGARLTVRGGKAQAGTRHKIIEGTFDFGPAVAGPHWTTEAPGFDMEL